MTGKKRIAVLAVGNATGLVGGAERFYQGLCGSLCNAGFDAEIVWKVSDESSFEAIEETYLGFYDLDLSAFDGVISTKAPGYIIRHPNHISYLQHTMRVFYDMFDYEFPDAHEELIKQRTKIQQLDTLALSFPRTKKLITIGNEVRKRLLMFNGLDSEVIYQDLTSDKYYCGAGCDYLFLPGRLHRWKRVDLAIRALKSTNLPLRLIISGSGEDEGKFHEAAGNDERIEFVGRVTDDQLYDLYSNALAVPFLPIHEDFGLITLEAFRSYKPVITCRDSGEPTFLVKNGETGFICEPTERDLADKFTYLYHHRDEARKMGKAGFESVVEISWEKVADKMIESLGF